MLRWKLRAMAAALVSLVLGLAPAPGIAQNLERGLAFTNPELMLELERRGFSLGAMLSGGWRLGERGADVNNRELSRLPALQPVLTTLNTEFAGYIARGGPQTGVGIPFLFRVFNRAHLSSDIARFELTGVVNRMDRAYILPSACGEIRLIYRLAYRAEHESGSRHESRLPMTLNLVLRANPGTDPAQCREIARRWIASGDLQLGARAMADRLIAANGPLRLVTPGQIDRIETNIQILRVPATMRPEFGGHADYLLNVFKWSADGRVFRRSVLENQIDRARLQANPQLLSDFKQWLFSPGTIRELDAGLIKIPDRFLATRAISVAPGGTARSQNRPLLGLVTDDEIEQALARHAALRPDLRNISSAAGFQQRLNDISCAGCHQSRAIGGFHFMGADYKASRDRLPQNSIFVPASAHFYGEAPRRRAVIEALAAGRPPNLARSFALRPRTGLAQGLQGTGLHNGWGAACNVSSDPSFAAWRCAAGLVCKAIHASQHEPGMGTCVTRGAASFGDPAEFGVVNMTAYGRDGFQKDEEQRVSLAPNLTAAPQAGGFFGGMVRRADCRDLPKSAVCARGAGRGFNSCSGEIGDTFERCLADDRTFASGLRACDQRTPCRDDYLCVATRTAGKGACLPPYFLFQFRVDGHPTRLDALSPIAR